MCAASQQFSPRAPSLVAEKIKLNRFEFVPFPIERHASIPDFVDAKATFYTTVCEPWNTEKIKKLNDLGLKVEVLWERQTKKFSGQEVRQSLIEGNENWKSMVHKAAIPLIENWGIGERLRILATPDTQLLPTDVSNGMELLSSG